MTGGKPKLRKAYRGVVDAARDEAALVGGTIEVDLCGKHPRVHLLLGREVHIIPFAGTPRVADNGPTAMRQRIRQKAKMCRDRDRDPEGDETRNAAQSSEAR